MADDLTQDRPRVRESFDDFYARAYADVVKLVFAVTLSHSAAEEIVQESFLATYTNWSDLRNPDGWVRVVALRRSTSWTRRQILERRHLRLQPLDEDMTPALCLSSDVVTALRRLKPKQRALAFFRYYLDYTEAEISAELNIPLGSVKSQLSRIRATLREELQR